MKAIRVHEFGGPEVLKYEDLEPPRAGSGQVTIRAKAVGVNPVDVSIRNGAYGKLVQPPYVPGSDAAGIVETVSPDVSHVKPGDRVFVTGTSSPGFTGAYAEVVVAPAARVHPLPGTLTFAQGAAIYIPYGTAYRSLVQRAGGKPGEWVLVHGASGGVGIASVQIGRSLGFNVVGTAGTDRGRELVKREGADHVLDHTAPDYLDRLMALTHGRGVDIILEMASHLNLAKDFKVIAHGGRVVVIGCRGPIEINPREAMSREASILGMHLGLVPALDAASMWAALGAGFAGGTLRPVVGREFPLQDAGAAQKAVMEDRAYGKIVLIP